MKKIKIYCPFHEGTAEENQQILQPGIEHSNYCELVTLPSKVRTLNDPRGPYIDSCPQTSGRPEDVDLMILHGSMQPDQAIVWREQYPDIPAVIMDYKDELRLYHPDVRVSAHFKRNMVHRDKGRPLGIQRYPGKPVHFSPYCVRHDILHEMEKHQKKPRDMDVCCFFDPLDTSWQKTIPKHWRNQNWNNLRDMLENRHGMCGTRRMCATTLQLAKEWYGFKYNMHLGKTGACQGDGRRTPQSEYCRLMATTKIIVSATPDGWEGDYRLMEALSSGALVLHNHMQLPPEGLVDGVHWVIYDNQSDMLEKVYYYTKNQEAANKIGQQGKNYVLKNHMPHHRVESWLNVLGLI